jgi:predicted nucleic acid-binding protein
LDRLAEDLDYLPLETRTLRRAAGLWAEARFRGQPTAPVEALDGDVILAAQALTVGGLVVTENVRHLQQFVRAYHWRDMPVEE